MSLSEAAFMAAQKRPTRLVRTWISASQLAELLGVEPRRFLGVEKRAGVRDDGAGWYVVMEPEDEAMSQTSGTFPQLTKTGKKAGGKKKGC